MLFPDGLAGLDLSRVARVVTSRLSRLRGKSQPAAPLSAPRELASEPSMTPGGAP